MTYFGEIMNRTVSSATVTSFAILKLYYDFCEKIRRFAAATVKVRRAETPCGLKRETGAMPVLCPQLYVP